MQRDSNLLRLLLEYVECKGKWKTFLPIPSPDSWPALKGYTDDQIAYHAYLCRDSAWLAGGGEDAMGWLSWQGQERLASLRCRDLAG